MKFKATASLNRGRGPVGKKHHEQWNPRTHTMPLALGAKKSLGQNFLISHTALAKIVASAELRETETVLEVGPGKGALTKRLLEHAKKVLAVEKDRRLIPILEETFASAIAMGKLTLIEADILTIDLQELGLRSGEFTVVANIPYYITGKLLRKLLSDDIQPNRIVLLLQKEVAQRIAGLSADRRDQQKESLLSLSTKAYGEATYVATVPRGAFTPIPKVDSAILKIDEISRDFFAEIDESSFFALLKLGFGKKRKQLIGNLSSHTSRNKLASIFVTLNLPLTTRAEDIPLATWGNLFKALTNAEKSPI